MKQNKKFFADFEIYASAFYGTLWEKNWVDIVVSNANKKDVKKNYMRLRLCVNDFVGIMDDFGEEMEGKEGCRCAEFKQGDNLIGVAVTNGIKFMLAAMYAKVNEIKYIQISQQFFNWRNKYMAVVFNK